MAYVWLRVQVRQQRLYVPHHVRATRREYDARRQISAANYAKFIELWKNADPELQPKVQEAKRRLARLGAEGR